MNMSKLKKLADMCSDYEVYTDGYHNVPIGSNDLKVVKEETINKIGEMLKEIIEEEKWVN